MTSLPQTKTATLTRTRGKVANAPPVLLASKIEIADNFFTRTIGLLGRDSIANGSGLWIKKCNSIHTFFMQFPIDVIFVDKKLKVISVCRDLKPWRITRLHFKATSVFELPAGTLDRAVEDTTGLKGDAIQPGDILNVEINKESGGANV